MRGEEGEGERSGREGQKEQEKDEGNGDCE